MTIIHRIFTSSLLVLALLCSSLSLSAQTGGQPEQGQIPLILPDCPKALFRLFPVPGVAVCLPAAAEAVR